MKTAFIRIFLLASIITANMSATAQTFASAIELNDYFVSITDSLFRGGQEWGNQMSKAVETKNFSSVTPVRKKMELFIDKKLASLDKMKDQFGSEKLRFATMDFLMYEKRLVQEGFIPLERLNKNTTDEDLKKAFASLSAAAEKETAEIQKVHKAQEEFAEKNGFAIEKDN